MNIELAENIAIQSLQYLSVNESYFDGFLAHSGTHPEQLKDVVNTREFQISILDYICLDEGLLLSFCQSIEMSPTLPYKAFQILSHYS